MSSISVLNAVLKTFGIIKNEEKTNTIYAFNSVEKYLMHNSENLICMQSKLVVADVIDGMQTDLSRKNPLFQKLSEKLDDLLSVLRSKNCFTIPSLLLR